MLFFVFKIQGTSVFDPYAGALFYIYILFFRSTLSTSTKAITKAHGMEGKNPCRIPATSRITRPAWSPPRMAPTPGTATRSVPRKCRTRPGWGMETAPGSRGISCVVSCCMSQLYCTQTRPLRGGELVILQRSWKITSEGG